jgi:hypothetical protein
MHSAQVRTFVVAWLQTVSQYCCRVAVVAHVVQELLVHGQLASRFLA